MSTALFKPDSVSEKDQKVECARDKTASSPQPSPPEEERKKISQTRFESDGVACNKLAHRILFGLFLAQWFLVWTGLLSQQPTLSPLHWPEGLLVLLAAGTTLATLACELPWQ